MELDRELETKFAVRGCEISQCNSHIECKTKSRLVWRVIALVRVSAKRRVRNSRVFWRCSAFTSCECDAAKGFNPGHSLTRLNRYFLNPHRYFSS